MWLNESQITAEAINAYKSSVLGSCPNYVVIDDLFNASVLDRVMDVLHENQQWKRQRHTYAELYVDDAGWQRTSHKERFVQRDVWQRSSSGRNIADQFVEYLRSPDFLALLSSIFEIKLTDLNVADSEINSNFFRLGAKDFVKQHVDDSPGREVCMLLYLNKTWQVNWGGQLTFLGANPINSLEITPVYNRCIFFKPASKGSEHWVGQIIDGTNVPYRYNMTSWYWSE